MSEPTRNRTVQWCAAAMAGVLVGLVPLFDDSPPARVLAVLLVAASIPFGLLRQRQPWVWALIVAWPTVTLRFSQAGWHSIFLVVYSMVGVYLGDWIVQWWTEAHPPARHNPADNAGGEVAADGSRVAADGLPPEMPGRF
ncbi:MAG TPA: hypothetical protein VHU88_09135 [Sporichthyaceae bacterium]|nr:hypothetical protein [Sporichthyaceae bacterium]